MRDLDVLIEHLEPEVERLGDGRSGGPEAAARRSSASAAAARGGSLAALDSERYLALLDALERPVATIAEARRWTRSTPRSTSASARRSARSTPSSPDEELHAARIKVKRARYAAELAGDGTAYVKAAKALQDVLGDHQDAVVAVERIRALVDKLPDDRARGRSPPRARAARGRVQRARRNGGAAWKRLAKTA